MTTSLYSPSLRRLLNIINLARQRSNLLKRGIMSLCLCELHVRALHALLKDIHDLGCNLTDLAVREIDGLQDRGEPIEALVDVVLEGRRQCCRYGERDQWAESEEVLWVDAHEEFVEELSLAWGLQPL